MDARLVRETPQGTVLAVYVQPKASRTHCAGLHGEALKVRVAAPPVDGAANEELLRFIARLVSVTPSRVRLESGAGTRLKRVFVPGLTATAVLGRVHAALQAST